MLASASNVGEHILSLLQYFQVGPRIQELLDIVGSSWLPALSGVLPQPYFGCVLHLGALLGCLGLRVCQVPHSCSGVMVVVIVVECRSRRGCRLRRRGGGGVVEEILLQWQ